MVYFFRRWSTDHDKDMVNYRLIKEAIMGIIGEFKSPQKSGFESGTLSSKFALRSETLSEIGSAYRRQFGGLGGVSQKNFESYIKKPLKAINLDTSPDRAHDGEHADLPPKLPKLNRFNVRALNGQSQNNTDAESISPDRRSQVSNTVSQTLFLRNINGKNALYNPLTAAKRDDLVSVSTIGGSRRNSTVLNNLVSNETPNLQTVFERMRLDKVQQDGNRSVAKLSHTKSQASFSRF